MLVTAVQSSPPRTPLPPADAAPGGAPPVSGEHLALVRHALGGDATAFGELIDRYERAALATAHAVTRDAALAADAVQEACLRAWDKRRTLDEPARFGPWLLHIARRCAIDQTRRRKRTMRWSELPPADAAMDAADPLERREAGELIHGALAELDEASRTATVLRYYEGMSSRQIAEVLGCSAAAVDMRLARARERLRASLGPRLDDL